MGVSGVNAATSDVSAPVTTTASRAKREERPWSPHLLAASDPAQLWRVFRRFGRQIDRKYFARAAAIPLVSLLHSPFALAESALTRRRIRKQPLAAPLVMIIGHWRSGTTNTHNYFLQDPRFAYVSVLHCLAPHEFLTVRRLARRLLRHLVFTRRPMDSVKTGLDEPMSEDFALVGVTDQTHYLGYFFPRLVEQTFRETVLFDGVPPERIASWARTYEWLLKKVSLASGGHPLVLKNPANTGRMRYLVDRFPQMKFVFVRRNPYIVHASTCRLMERFLSRWSLQEWDRRDLEQAVLRRHAWLLQRYFEDRALIPEGRLVEIQHEEMVARPVETMQDIYHRLELGDFERVRPDLERYAESVAEYRTNKYEFDSTMVAAVRESLGFVLEAWGYVPPT